MTPDRIRQIFKGLETGAGAAFFAHVADDVDWTVMGTHPLAGHYRSKADYAGTFAKLGQGLAAGRPATRRARHGEGRRSGRRASVSGDGDQRDAVRQPLLHGARIRWRDHRPRSLLPRLGDGGASVRGKSNRVRVAHLYVVFRSKRGECHVCDPADPARMIDQGFHMVREPAIARCEDTDAVKLWRTDHKFQS